MAGEGRRLWKMRYKHHLRGVREDFIQASSLERAEAVGQAFCEKSPGNRFISVGEAVVADESILAPELPVAVTEPEKVKKTA